MMSWSAPACNWTFKKIKKKITIGDLLEFRILLLDAFLDIFVLCYDSGPLFTAVDKGKKKKKSRTEENFIFSRNALNIFKIISN